MYKFSYIYTYYPHYMTPLDHSKLSILNKIGSLWASPNLWDMVGRCMPNSGPGGYLGTRVLTILVSHVATQRANPY